MLFFLALMAPRTEEEKRRSLDGGSMLCFVALAHRGRKRRSLLLPYALARLSVIDVDKLKLNL